MLGWCAPEARYAAPMDSAAARALPGDADVLPAATRQIFDAFQFKPATPITADRSAKSSTRYKLRFHYYAKGKKNVQKNFDSYQLAVDYLHNFLTRMQAKGAAKTRAAAAKEVSV